MSYAPDTQQPYAFGFPDELVDIHFPKRNRVPKNASQPWYFYITPQTPTFFQFIGGNAKPPGHGWQCTTNLPVIKILPIDTQPIVPTTEVGFGSLEEVINKTNEGKPISADAWGRFNFKNQFFWDVIGQKAPKWASFANGLPQNPVNDGHRGIDKYIEQAVKFWKNTWNNDAGLFNAATLAVTGEGDYTVMGPGGFALPSPGSGYIASISFLQQNVGKYYFGAIPPTAVFERGQALIFKQSFAFNFAIDQLDANKWDMSVFPPRDTTLILGDPGFRTVDGEDRGPSAITGNFSGYANQTIFAPFPLIEPVIV